MPTLAATATDLREQWERLRAWLEELPDPASDEPSTLPGWSLGVLVAHLGRVWDSIRALRPPEPGDDAEPLTLAEYLATYRADDPERLDRLAHEVAASVRQDPLAAIDALAEDALARVDELVAEGDVVVLARRGPIRLGDFLVSRLIELVVHAYDLAPTLPLPPPVDPTARTLVAQALLDVATQRTGTAIEVADETAWVLAASGRLDWRSAVARGAVRPSAVSDGTPDLTDALPLL